MCAHPHEQIQRSVYEEVYINNINLIIKKINKKIDKNNLNIYYNGVMARKIKISIVDDGRSFWIPALPLNVVRVMVLLVLPLIQKDERLPIRFKDSKHVKTLIRSCYGVLREHEPFVLVDFQDAKTRVRFELR